jgi:hypothetical protein
VHDVAHDIDDYRDGPHRSLSDDDAAPGTIRPGCGLSSKNDQGSPV